MSDADYARLSRIKRTPHPMTMTCWNYWPKYSDGFAIIGIGAYWDGKGGYRIKRALCVVHNTLDMAVDNLAKWQRWHPNRHMTIMHCPAEGKQPWDGVSLTPPMDREAMKAAPHRGVIYMRD